MNSLDSEEKETEVLNQLSLFEDSISTLSSSILKLTNRLDIVLSDPQERSDCCKTEPQTHCKLSRDLQSLRHEIDDITENLNELIERLMI